MRSDRLADYLQVWGFQDDVTIFTDGSLGFSLEAVPIDISCWEDERIGYFAERLRQFLNGLPEGVDIQFVRDIGRGNGEVIEAHLRANTAGTEEMPSVLCKSRVDRLEDLDSKGKLARHGLYVFVRRTLTERLVGKPSLLKSKKLFPKIAEDKLEKEIRGIQQLKKDLIQSLDSIGVFCRQLTEAETAGLMYRQWNPSRNVPKVDFSMEDVRSSVTFTDVAISDRGFSLGGLHYRVLSLKLLPDQTYASMSAIFQELPFDSRLYLSVHVPNQQKELESLQSQRRLAFAMVHGKTRGVRDIESQAKLTDIETLLEEMVAAGEKVFRVSLNVLLCAGSAEELESQVSHTLLKVRELGGAEGMEETLASFDIFSEFAVPNARAGERAKRLKTSNLADFLPMFGPWRGHSEPSILLRTRAGSLVGFDPFHHSLTNANQIVSGGSGSGKSFLANILLLHKLKEQPRIYVIDIGGSYRKLCENL